MKKTAILALTCLSALLPVAFAAPEEAPDPHVLVKVAEAVRPSFVIVEYTLRFDRGEAPYSVFGAHWNDGGYQGAYDLAEVVDEERPLEVWGLLVGPSKVLTSDLMLNDRFVEKVEVRAKGGAAPAKVAARFLKGGFMVLDVAGELSGAAVLPFDGQKPGPYFAASFGRDGATFAVTVEPLGKGVLVRDNGTRLLAGSIPIVVDKDGTGVGIGVAEVGIAKGDPLALPALSAEEMAAKAAETMEAKVASVLRVRLEMRSPRKSDEGNDYWYSGDDDSGATTLDVPGVALPGNRLLVIAPLDRKETARLKTIRVHPAAGDPVEAKFAYTLKYFQGFVADLSAPLPAVAELSDRPVEQYAADLLFGAEVLVRGEVRTVWLGFGSFYFVSPGWRRLMHPEVGQGAGPVFLFDLQGRLVALPLNHRPRVTENQGWRGGAESGLLSSVDLAAILADPAANSDPGNVPVKESEEGRMCWMGVVLQPLDNELARMHGVSELTNDGSTGGLVSYVYPGSPAAEQGIRQGDILLRLHAEGYPKPIEAVGDPMPFAMPDWWRMSPELREELPEMQGPMWPKLENRLNQMLTRLGEGAKCRAEVYRDGEVISTDFTVAQAPLHYGSAPRLKSETLKMTVRDLTFEVRTYYQMEPGEPGVIVSDVEEGGKADVAGMIPFEVVTHVDGEPVPDIAAFKAKMEREGERLLTLKIMTRTRILKVQVPPAK